MSFDPKNKTLIPCEPFESTVYDLNVDAFVKAKITGYWVAIRGLRNPNDPMFMPISVGKVEPRHGIIVAPAWESLEPLDKQVSASPQEG